MRRWHRHWSFWIFISIFVLFSIVSASVLSLRLMGKNDYKQVITSLQDAGEIATLDEFISSLPPVDESVQGQWKQTLDRMTEQEMSKRVTDEQWSEYFIHGKTIAQDALDEHELARPIAEELIRIVLEEKPIITTAGYLASLLPPEKRDRFESYRNLNSENLGNCRSFAYWLGCELFLNPHNAKARHAFDAVVHNFSPCGSFIDAMYALGIQLIRNETYVTLAYYRRLPPDVFEFWCNESPNGLLLVSEGFVTERVISIDGLMMSLGDGIQNVFYINGRSSSLTTWESTIAPFYGVYFWSTIHHDAAIISNTYQCISKRLRGEIKVSIPAFDKVEFWGLGHMMMANLKESCITALDHEASHRIYRLATRLMNDVTIPLPKDTEALSKQLPYTDKYIRPTGDAFHLLYERISDTRFRLLIDPASPPIDFDDASRMLYRCSQMGKPAAKERVVLDYRNIELDLAGRPESKP